MKRLLIIGLACVATSTVVAQTVSPGLWHDETEYTLNGKPLPKGTSPDGCLGESDARDMRATMQARLVRDNMGCKITDWNYVATHLNVGLSCKNAQGSGTMKLAGSVTPTAYDLKGTIKEQNVQLGPITADVTMKGHRVGECH